MTFRLISLCLCSFLITTPVWAASPLQQLLIDCKKEQDSIKRLACFDSIATETATLAEVVQQPAEIIKPTATLITDTTQSESIPEETTREAEIAVVTAKEELRSENFGLEHRQSATEQADVLYVTVAAVSYTARKELIVEFDNGQRWRQLGSDTYFINTGEQHYLKRGTLNSFFLGKDGSNRTIRVRREK